MTTVPIMIFRGGLTGGVGRSDAGREPAAYCFKGEGDAEVKESRCVLRSDKCVRHV